MSQPYNFSFIQGDSYALNLAIADNTGSILNISGNIFQGEAKLAFTDVTASWGFTCSVQIPGLILNAAPSSGSLSITVSPSSSAAINAGPYVYSIRRIVDSNTVQTILFGNVVVSASVFG